MKQQEQQRLDTRPKAAWVSGLRLPTEAAGTAKSPGKQRLVELRPQATPSEHAPQLHQHQSQPPQPVSFADLGPSERRRLAELVAELGRLAEAKERAERGLSEERQRRRREVGDLRADLESQRRALADVEARLASDPGRPRSVASQCESPPPPPPLPPPPACGRRPFTERIDREILCTPCVPPATVSTTAAAAPTAAAPDDMVVALLHQQLRLSDRTQRHLCRQLRELCGRGTGASGKDAGSCGGGGNRILRGPEAADSADEFFVLPGVLRPPEPQPDSGRIRRHQGPPPSALGSSPPGQRPDSLLDLVEAVDGPQLPVADEGEGEDDEDDSEVLEDLFFLS